MGQNNGNETSHNGNDSLRTFPVKAFFIVNYTVLALTLFNSDLWVLSAPGICMSDRWISILAKQLQEENQLQYKPPKEYYVFLTLIQYPNHSIFSLLCADLGVCLPYNEVLKLLKAATMGEKAEKG